VDLWGIKKKKREKQRAGKDSMMSAPRHEGREFKGYQGKKNDNRIS